MPNLNWFDILSISIFCKIALSISISISIFSKITISISISILIFLELPYRYRYFQKWPYRYRYQYFQEWPYRYRYRYQYFSKVSIYRQSIFDIVISNRATSEAPLWNFIKIWFYCWKEILVGIWWLTNFKAPARLP